MRVLKKQQGLGVARLEGEASIIIKQLGIVWRRLPLRQLAVPLFLAAVVIFTPCLASQDDINDGINEKTPEGNIWKQFWEYMCNIKGTSINIYDFR